MNCMKDSLYNLSLSHQENRNSTSTRRKLHCGPPQYKFRIGGLRCILLLIILSITSSFVHSYVPEKYPIEVYHMLKERTQYGFGKDNRVRGSWGSWSAWSECSRSCGTGVQSQSRQCVLRSAVMRKRSAVKEINSTILKPVCIGTYKRYHICNTQECPDFSVDFRSEQCAKYNDRLYKGEKHAWIPFLNAPNPCALNCRAVGQRFYATLEPAVVDGTPCDGPNLRGKSMGFTVDRTEQWVCVAGQCRSVGCDGVIGSGAVKDTCGVCGGQGRSCKLFEGIFMEPILPKGHQPITTIPRGAMSLNISELRYSSNFLALRKMNGSYILNGPWSISPSGIYKAAGSIVNYQRGDRNRIESITATGPLSEPVNLEIWYHEMNPGILYKYMLPVAEIADGNTIIAPPLYANEIPEHHVLPVQMSRRHSKIDLSQAQENEGDRKSNKKEDVKFSPTTVMAGDAPNVNLSDPKVKKKKKKKKFTWKVMGLSPCSKTCGGGVQSTIIKCGREDKNNSVPDRRCKKFEKPPVPPPVQCNNRPCPARWRADVWSDCSVTCGSGVKTRRLECVQDLNPTLTMRVAAGACPQPPDLSTVGACTGPPCVNITESRQTDTQSIVNGVWETGPWSACSSTCGKGFKYRQIVCNGSKNSCSGVSRPVAEEPCETPCHSEHHQSVWLYSEWSLQCTSECDRGFKMRKVACSDRNELFCDSSKKPVSKQQCSMNSTRNCTPKWFTGPWSSCSVQCGEGIIRREVICIGYSYGESNILSESNCTSSRPPAEQNCRMPACPPEWFTSDWNMCSVTCGGGTQERVVRCLEDGIESLSCDDKIKPIYRRSCNTDSCNKDIVLTNKIPKDTNINSDCIDKYPNCQLVVKAGLCRVKFYKHSCCGCRSQL